MLPRLSTAANTKRWIIQWGLSVLRRSVRMMSSCSEGAACAAPSVRVGYGVNGASLLEAIEVLPKIAGPRSGSSPTGVRKIRIPDNSLHARRCSGPTMAIDSNNIVSVFRGTRPRLLAWREGRTAFRHVDGRRHRPVRQAGPVVRDDGA